MNEGWIMLHRKMLDNPIVRRPHYCHLWVVLLLKATHQESGFIFNNRRQSLKPGQLITGRNKLSEETGIPPSTVEHILNYLESEQQIGQEKKSKFRIITVKNWDKYQAPKKVGQHVDSQ